MVDVAHNYICRDGDMLDHICWKHYGQQSGAVEAVLRANTGLSALGPTLPAGLRIVLPVLPKPVTVVETIRLWD